MGKRNTQLLDRVDRRAARLISGTCLSEYVSDELLLSCACLSLLASHRNFRLALFASRFLSDLVPLHLSKAMDHWRQSVSGCALLLRRPPAVFLPRAKKKILSTSPLFQALSLWNSLPPELRTAPLTELKSHFFWLVLRSFSQDFSPFCFPFLSIPAVYPSPLSFPQPLATNSVLNHV